MKPDFSTIIPTRPKWFAGQAETLRDALSYCTYRPHEATDLVRHLVSQPVAREVWRHRRVEFEAVLYIFQDDYAELEFIDGVAQAFTDLLSDYLLSCQGCGSTEPDIEVLRARGHLSCCPERSMRYSKRLDIPVPPRKRGIRIK